MKHRNKIVRKKGAWNGPLYGKMIGIGTVILVLLAGVIQCSADRQDVLDNKSTFTVRPGPLTISVIESGTIKAREQVILKSEVEGKTTILSLVKEGTQAKKGKDL